MAANDRESRINRLARYRWKPGQSGNAAGRPKKRDELRWYVEGAMLNVPIAPEFYRNAMVICGMQREVEQLDALLLSGAKLQDISVQKVIPSLIKKLCYGEYAAMRACFEACKNPDLFLKIIDQVHGKPVQPTTVANADGTQIKSPPASNVVVVTVPVADDGNEIPWPAGTPDRR
jgi:hypothetical protein